MTDLRRWAGARSDGWLHRDQLDHKGQQPQENGIYRMPPQQLQVRKGKTSTRSSKRRNYELDNLIFNLLWNRHCYFLQRGSAVSSGQKEPRSIAPQWKTLAEKPWRSQILVCTSARELRWREWWQCWGEWGGPWGSIGSCWWWSWHRSHTWQSGCRRGPSPARRPSPPHCGRWRCGIRSWRACRPRQCILLEIIFSNCICDDRQLLQ